MPSPMLKKLAQDTGTPLKTLEEYWNKAKKIAYEKLGSKDGDRYWAYTQGIFSNMARVASRSSDTSESKAAHQDLPDWWLKKTEPGRKRYLADHPGSKLSNKVKRMTPAQRKQAMKQKASKKSGVGGTRVKKPTGIKDPSGIKAPEGIQEPSGIKAPEGIQDPTSNTLQEDPHSEPAPTPAVPAEPEEDEPKGGFVDLGVPSAEGFKDTIKDYGHNVKQYGQHAVRAAQHAYRKGRHAVKMGLMKDRHGLHAVNKFFKGEKLTDDEKASAKTLAKHAGIAVLGILGAVALMSPLGPYASVIGDEFMAFSKNFFNSESGSEELDAQLHSFSSDEDEVIAEQFSDRMYHWLLEQDPEELAASLAEKYPDLST